MPVTTDFSSSAEITPSASSFVPSEKSAIQLAKEALFVDTAKEKWLAYIGQNWNIARPKLAPTDDVMYSRIIQAIAVLPKTILSTLYYLLEAIFGSQASIVAVGGRPWRVYQVNPNELIIEIPVDLLAASNESATYLHGFSGVVLSGATTTVFSCSGDVRVSAVNLVGLGASVLINGVYEEKTISIVSYNSTTDQMQLTTAAYSNAPTAGAPFFVNVPGDGTSSYRGDYVGQTAFIKSTATSVGADTLTDSTLAMTTDQYVGYYLRFTSIVFYRITSNTATTFTLAGNGATPPLAEYTVNKHILDADEAVDEATTPPHADRIYITGDGKFEIARQYLESLVLASGVVLRLEKV